MISGLKEKLRSARAQDADAIVNLAGFLTVIFIFAVGIGRYRSVLVYAVYSLLNFTTIFMKPVEKLRYLVLPAAVISVFVDISRGPIWPLFDKNSLMAALPIMIVVDTVVRNYVEKGISTISKGRLFIVCPACSNDNKVLVEKCTACSYISGVRSIAQKEQSTQLGTEYNIPSRVVNMLHLSENEKILFHKKISTTAIFKNGIRQARTNFLITTTDVILLDYFRFAIRSASSWREKDVIPLIDIKAVEGKMKKIYLAQEPFMAISTVSDDVYEIVFSRKEKKMIIEIAEIIKNLNPQVYVSVELT